MNYALRHMIKIQRPDWLASCLARCSVIGDFKFESALGVPCKGA